MGRSNGRKLSPFDKGQIAKLYQWQQGRYKDYDRSNIFKILVQRVYFLCVYDYGPIHEWPQYVW